MDVKTINETGLSVQSEETLQPEARTGAGELAVEIPAGCSRIDNAIVKLREELKTSSPKGFAEPVIGYLVERCRESESLAADICQGHKTWKKCFDYICAQAKKMSGGICAAVPDAVVYEWAEDYYRKDDKAEEKEKAAEVTEKRTRRRTADRPVQKRAEEKQKVQKNHTGGDKNVAGPVPQKEEAGRTRKNRREMEGQIDMFSMMDM